MLEMTNIIIQTCDGFSTGDSAVLSCNTGHGEYEYSVGKDSTPGISQLGFFRAVRTLTLPNSADKHAAVIQAAEVTKNNPESMQCIT